MFHSNLTRRIVILHYSVTGRLSTTNGQIAASAVVFHWSTTSLAIAMTSLAIAFFHMKKNKFVCVPRQQESDFEDTHYSDKSFDNKLRI